MRTSTCERRRKHDLQLQMAQPGVPPALREPLIKQLSGPLPGEPENKLLLAVERCGLE